MRTEPGLVRRFLRPRRFSLLDELRSPADHSIACRSGAGC